MAQIRLINFGDTVLADRINQISTAIVQYGVVSGAEFTLFDSQTLAIAPSVVMLHTLLLQETVSTNISISLTADAKDYTIAYEHINQNIQGGVSATLLRLDGIFAFDDLENTVILGWVRYPGGSVPLEVEFFIEAPKLQIKNPTEFPSDLSLPPYLNKIQLQEEDPISGSITQTDMYDVANTQAFLELENTADTIQSITHYFPFVAKESPPDRLIVEISAELGASVTIELVAEDGTVFSAANNIISNTSNLFEFREMRVENMDDSKFDQNRPYFVSLKSQINPGRKAFISLVGTNVNFLPF